MINKRKVVPLGMEEVPELSHSGVRVVVDEAFVPELITLLADPVIRKKFRRILYVVLMGQYDEDLYGREEVSGKAKGVTAMKFKGKMNLRIYCKEVVQDGKKVVLVTALLKKTQKVNKSLKTLLETIGGYQFDLSNVE